MLSKRTVMSATFFQSTQPAVQSADEIEQLQVSITEQNRQLAINKFFLLSLKDDLLEARAQDRSHRNILFSSKQSASGSYAEILKKYRDLKEEIDKQEQAITLCQINLKQLKNEELCAALQEKAEQYSRNPQVDLMRIFQI